MKVWELWICEKCRKFFAVFRLNEVSSFRDQYSGLFGVICHYLKRKWKFRRRWWKQNQNRVMWVYCEDLSIKIFCQTCINFSKCQFQSLSAQRAANAVSQLYVELKLGYARRWDKVGFLRFLYIKKTNFAHEISCEKVFNKFAKAKSRKVKFV